MAGFTPDSDAFYKSLLDNLHDGVYFVDQHRRITYWNKAAERITGFTAEEVMGHCCADNILMHINDKGESMCKGMCPLAHTLKDGDQHEDELYLRHKKGHRVPVVVRVSPVRDIEGEIVGAVEIFFDNSSTKAIMQRVKDLQQMALIDEVTKLANRRYMEYILRTRNDQLHRYGWNYGLLFVDLDHFKKVNDTWGHDTGDEVLRMVGRTLVGNMRPFDVVGRWGGEEFIAVVVNTDDDELFAIADRLRFLVSQSGTLVNDKVIQVTISVGATMAGKDENVDAVLKRADELVYQSKSRGRNCVTMG